MRRAGVGSLIAAGLLAVPVSARAQALPPPGVGTVTVSFQTIDNTGHRLTDGRLIDNGRSRTHALGVEFEVGLTRRWSIGAGVPLVFARYTDDDPPPPFLPFLPRDQCRCWQSGWQDVSLATRVNVVDTLDHVTVVTPSIEVGLPSHGYEYKGEAVLGRRLRELRLAVDASRRLDGLSHRITLGGRYSYAVVERVLDVPNNRSNLTGDISVRVTPAVAVRAFAAWQWTHGGLRVGSLPGSNLPAPGDLTTPERIAEHDRLLRDNRVHVGAGISYRLARGQVYATYTHFARGTDTHAGRAVTGGLVVPFRVRP